MSTDSGVSADSHQNTNIWAQANANAFDNGDLDDNAENDSVVLRFLQRILICSNCRGFLAISSRWIIRNEMFLAFPVDVSAKDTNFLANLY